MLAILQVVGGDSAESEPHVHTERWHLSVEIGQFWGQVAG